MFLATVNQDALVLKFVFDSATCYTPSNRASIQKH